MEGQSNEHSQHTETGRGWMFQKPWWFCVWFQGFQQSLGWRRPREDTDDNPQSYRRRRLGSRQSKNDSHLQVDVQRVQFLNLFLNCSTHGRNEDHFIWMRCSRETPREFPQYVPSDSVCWCLPSINYLPFSQCVWSFKDFLWETLTLSGKSWLIRITHPVLITD